MNKTAAVTGKKFTTQRLALMAMFAAILCISAYISVPLPLTGYHVTFLNFVITLIALVFPLEQSLLISIVWLLLGAVGVPVFIGGNAGIGYLMGPLGGYSFSFILVAILVPLLRGAKYNRIRFTIVSVASVVFVDLFGMVWLKFMNNMPWATAWAAGFFSFIILDLVKAVVAAQIVPAFRKVITDQSQE